MTGTGKLKGAGQKAPFTTIEALHDDQSIAHEASKMSEMKVGKSEMLSVAFASKTLQTRIAPAGCAPSVKARIRYAARKLGWSVSRTKDVWYADPRVSIDVDEMRVIEETADVKYGRAEVRSIDELIGLCRGFLADGAIVQQEAEFLRDWVDRHAEFRNDFPYNIVYQRLHEALEDGVLDSDEEADLLDCIAKLVGGEIALGEVASLATALPLDNPEPPILLPAHTFVVTGTFSYGPRRDVCKAIAERGGEIKPSISKNVNYLVVGTVGSRDWIHSSYGRKIEAAVELRQQGIPIAVVSENHWVRYL